MDNNSDSFDTFFRRCLPKLVTFLITLGVAREEAQDAAAEAMVRAYVVWGTVRQPEAWVRVVAQRVAVNDLARRREGVRRAVAGGWLVDSCSDAETFILKEEHETVLALLSQLPDIQRTVMAWYMDGFGPAEIAGHLGMKPNTVRSHLRHARRRLQQAFRKMAHDRLTGPEGGTRE